jgi:hypothetical protein
MTNVVSTEKAGLVARIESFEEAATVERLGESSEIA